jgi:16S rRNA (guanine1516-N2)-methyltransferase
MTAIGFSSDDNYEKTCVLAQRYGFVIDNHILPRLNVTSEKLELLTGEFSPLSIDFSQHIWQHRRDAGKNQGIVRACKPEKNMQILDTTAGWGRDAAVLSSFGASVLMLERQPIMAALLADALERLEPNTLSLSLVNQDAKVYLNALLPEDYPHVIYIDPMHPLRQKSALVKKDMQILQQLFGPDEDVSALIHLACKRAQLRVVVKWPQRLPPLLKPSHSIEGKTVRFDVYVI